MHQIHIISEIALCYFNYIAILSGHYQHFEKIQLSIRTRRKLGKQALIIRRYYQPLYPDKAPNVEARRYSLAWDSVGEPRVWLVVVGWLGVVLVGAWETEIGLEGRGALESIRKGEGRRGSRSILIQRFLLSPFPAHQLCPYVSYHYEDPNQHLPRNKAQGEWKSLPRNIYFAHLTHY